MKMRTFSIFYAQYKVVAAEMSSQMPESEDVKPSNLITTDLRALPIPSNRGDCDSRHAQSGAGYFQQRQSADFEGGAGGQHVVY